MKNIQDIDRIIHSYIQGGLSKNLRDLIQGWLLANEDSAEIDQTLFRMFDGESFVMCDPSEMKADLEKIKRRLGFPVQKQKPIPILRRKGSMVAAVITMLFVITGALLFLKGEKKIDEKNVQKEFITLTVDQGKENYIMLPDSSKVWLNGSSKLSYGADFQNERVVYLEGEAYFAVVHAQDHSPFIVKTDALEVKVLGTEFNVKAYKGDADAEVTLKKGAVEVWYGDKKVFKPEPNIKVIVDRATARMYTKKVSENEMKMELDVREFNGARLSDIFKYLAVQYKVVFAVDDDFAESVSIRIKFKGTETLEDALFALRYVTDEMFEYRIEDKIVYIYKK